MLRLKLFWFTGLAIAIAMWVTGHHLDSFVSGLLVIAFVSVLCMFESQCAELERTRQHYIDEIGRHRQTLDSMRSQLGMTWEQVSALEKELSKP